MNVFAFILARCLAATDLGSCLGAVAARASCYIRGCLAAPKLALLQPDRRQGVLKLSFSLLLDIFSVLRFDIAIGDHIIEHDKHSTSSV